MNVSQTTDLWDVYKTTGDKDIKNQLIEHYAPLIKLVAGRLGIYLSHYVDFDDLIGYGVMGLIDAIDKFDNDKKVKFETYASIRIRGAILDEVRKMDWAPRSLRQKHKEFQREYAYLETTLGRGPTEEEIIAHLQTTPEEYAKILRDNNITSLVFIEDHKIEVENTADVNASEPEKVTEKNEAINILTDVINKLPDKQKMVVNLYYYEELTLKEISVILDVSESRVSQIHSKAVSKMRHELNSYNIYFPL